MKLHYGRCQLINKFQCEDNFERPFVEVKPTKVDNVANINVKLSKNHESNYTKRFKV